MGLAARLGDELQIEKHTDRPRLWYRPRALRFAVGTSRSRHCTCSRRCWTMRITWPRTHRSDRRQCDAGQSGGVQRKAPNRRRRRGQSISHRKPPVCSTKPSNCPRRPAMRFSRSNTCCWRSRSRAERRRRFSSRPASPRKTSTRRSATFARAARPTQPLPSRATRHSRNTPATSPKRRGITSSIR